MTLYEIIDILKKISLTQPNIRTATDGDIFDKMNGNPSVRYGVFHITQTTHTEDAQFDNYGFNLFVLDRLEDDDANRVSAQSTAKQILSNIIATFCETFDAENEVITYQPFTQRFKDNTCGVWASVVFQVLKDYSCAETYVEGAWRPEIVIINNQDITISKNGIYEPSEGFTGFGKVDVYVPVPEIKESVSLFLTAGDTGVYRPEEPYDGVGEVVYEVEPNQHKVLNISENGDYVVMPDEYYGGLSHIDVNVQVPDLNGSYDEGYDIGYGVGLTEGYDSGYLTGYETGNVDGYERGVDEAVDTLPTLDITENGVYDQPSKGVNVNVIPKINIEESGIKFAYSTITEVPDWCDWTNISSFENMFYTTHNLSTIPLIDTSNVTTFNNAFAYCWISTIPLLDTSKATTFEGMFTYCWYLEEIPPFDTSNVTTFKNAFSSCDKVKTLPSFNTSKVTDFYYAFSMSNLESLPAYDCSSVGDGYGTTYFFGYAQKPKLTELGGFINIKTSIETYGIMLLPNLTYQSCINVLNGLYDFTGNGETPTSAQGKLKVHANFLTAVGDEISIATEKGWVVTT